MSRCARRVMVGQTAAIHGLVLAGVGYAMACSIVGVSHSTGARYVSRDYRRANMTLRKYRDVDLVVCRAAYADGSLPVKVHAYRLGLSTSYLYWLARYHGWSRKDPYADRDSLRSASRSSSPVSAAAARPVCPTPAGRAPIR